MGILAKLLSSSTFNSKYMKKFILNSSYLVMLILFFNGVVFLFAKSVYSDSYEKYPGKNYSSFIMADSHGLPIGDYSEKFNVYNFSGASDSYFDIKRKIYFLIGNDFKVDTIYLSVDDYTLSPYRENANNLDRSIIYASENEYNNKYAYFKEKYFKYYLAIFQPKVRTLLSAYLKAASERIFQQGNYVSIKDPYWNELSEAEQVKRAKSRKHLQFPTTYNSDKLEKALLEIIDLCQANNITLIGIKFPLTSTYVKILGDLSYGADELFYSKGLTVIDKKTMFTDDNRYFANQDHLNAEGGKLFTKTLLNE